MQAQSGSEVLAEVLRSEGVEYVFGNPGTTELPVIEMLGNGDDLPRYVLALQESSVVAIADGYALATGRPAFVNLHAAAGLGNGIGNLVNARANGTPLVVTAGQQDRRHLHHDPLLAGDLVGMAGPVCKWAHEVRTLAELPVMLRRAFQDVASSPTGPVFVGIPSDLLDEQDDVEVAPPAVIDRRTVSRAVDELAKSLLAVPAGRIALVIGDECTRSGAFDTVVAVAERLGAAVWGESLHSLAVFPTRHPLWRGGLPSSAVAISAALAEFGAVFFVGGQLLKVYPWSPGPALPAHVELFHLSPDVAQLGRYWPTRLGVVGDLRSTLEALDKLLTQQGRAQAEPSAPGVHIEREKTAHTRFNEVPMAPDAAALALTRALPAGTPVVNEAITTGLALRDFLNVTSSTDYFFSRGGGLGWGMPAAVGVSLGLGRRPVLSVVGDGSAMYSPQAMWTAAREKLPVVFVVVDNGRYLILEQALCRRPSAESCNRYPGLELGTPSLDFTALAASMGVPAQRVEIAADVGDALRSALAVGGPQLLVLPIGVG